MSLKAKIEAVIYASEEPVTLAQLTGLLGQEAQAELDHLDSAQQLLLLDAALPAELEAAPFDAAEPESLPEADIEGATEPGATEPGAIEPGATDPGATEPAAAKATEPEPTDSAPTQEPEPTDDSPVPEHPAEPALTSTDAKSVRQDEKNRDRRLREYFRSILDELIADYATSERGLEIREVAERISASPPSPSTTTPSAAS